MIRLIISFIILLFITFFTVPATTSNGTEIIIPEIPKQANSIDDFVPGGWKILKSAKGDLNGDKIEDYVLILKNILEDQFDNLPRLMLTIYVDKTKKFNLEQLDDKTVLCKNCIGNWVDDPLIGIEISNQKLAIHQLPIIPDSANEISNFVPKDWTISKQVEGVINKRKSHLIVIQKNSTSKEDKLHRILIVLQKDKFKKYKTELITHKIIKSLNLDMRIDPFKDIKISNNKIIVHHIEKTPDNIYTWIHRYININGIWILESAVNSTENIMNGNKYLVDYNYVRKVALERETGEDGKTIKKITNLPMKNLKIIQEFDPWSN